jgi:methylmalonyl-CoA mutase
MTMNGAVIPILAFFIVAGRNRAFPPSSSTGPSRTTSSRSSWSATPTSIRPSLRCGSFRTSSPIPREHAEVQFDLDLRLSHAGSRRDAVQELAFTIADGMEYVRAAWQAGLDIDKFAGRLSFFFGIGMNFFMEVAKLRAARRAVAPGDDQAGRAGRALQDAAHPLPDLGRVAAGAGPLQQRHPHHDRGDGGDAGRYPVAAHQRARRGDRAADRFLGAHRPQHADRDPGRKRHVQCRRSAGRLLLCRGADAGTGRQGVGDHRARSKRLGGMAKAVAAGWPKAMIEEAAAARQARVDKGEDVIVGVNKYRLASEEHLETLEVDNHARSAKARSPASTR